MNEQNKGSTQMLTIVVSNDKTRNVDKEVTETKKLDFFLNHKMYIGLQDKSVIKKSDFK